MEIIGELVDVDVRGIIEVEIVRQTELKLVFLFRLLKMD